jgi:hypothetical protein
MERAGAHSWGVYPWDTSNTGVRSRHTPGDLGVCIQPQPGIVRIVLVERIALSSIVPGYRGVEVMSKSS